MIGGSTEYEIKRFLWYKDESANSDKVWGIVVVGGKAYTFWGKRADLGGKKKLTFKGWPGSYGVWEAEDLARSKIRKGYNPVNVDKDAGGAYSALEAVYPDFFSSFRSQLVLAKLSDRIMNEGSNA
jgi:predicted DNA-binding WGR domain protein